MKSSHVLMVLISLSSSFAFAAASRHSEEAIAKRLVLQNLEKSEDVRAMRRQIRAQMPEAKCAFNVISASGHLATGIHYEAELYCWKDGAHGGDHSATFIGTVHDLSGNLGLQMAPIIDDPGA